MKENKYDDNTFFDKYSQLLRSQIGLDGAGEWYELKKILPDFKDKYILDLGCGYGWHCKFAADNKAKAIIGVDISEKMLEIAQKKNFDNKITYIHSAIEDFNADSKSFDIIISSLALHYVKDYACLIDNIYQWLKPNGEFIFSVEHPVFTAQGNQDWYYDENGNILHFPVDNYYYEGKRNAIFLGEKVIKYHRTLTTYLNTLLQKGFEIQHVIEPKPPKNMIDLPGMKDEMRRPMMLLISARKK